MIDFYSGSRFSGLTNRKSGEIVRPPEPISAYMAFQSRTRDYTFYCHGRLTGDGPRDVLLPEQN